MDLPDFIDQDIFYSFGFWMMTLGTMIAFLIGFKLADTGLLGVAGDSEVTIPLFTKVILILLTPVISYLVSLKVFNR